MVPNSTVIKADQTCFHDGKDFIDDESSEGYELTMVSTTLKSGRRVVAHIQLGKEGQETTVVVVRLLDE